MGIGIAYRMFAGYQPRRATQDICRNAVCVPKVSILVEAITTPKAHRLEIVAGMAAWGFGRISATADLQSGSGTALLG